MEGKNQEWAGLIQTDEFYIRERLTYDASILASNTW